MATVELKQVPGNDFIEKLARAIAINMQIPQQTNVASIATQPNCTRCGYRAHKNRNDCPAMGQTCYFCEKRDHFASVCFKKQGRIFTPVQSSNKATLNIDTEVLVKDTESKEWNVRGTLVKMGNFGQYGILKSDGSFSWEYPWFVKDVNDLSEAREPEDDELEAGAEVDVKDRKTKQWKRGILTRLDHTTNRCRIQWLDGTFTWENRRFVKIADGDDSKPQNLPSETGHLTNVQ